MQGWIPRSWDHDLSKNRESMLNQVSLPGAPELKSFNPVDPKDRSDESRSIVVEGSTQSHYREDYVEPWFRGGKKSENKQQDETEKSHHHFDKSKKKKRERKKSPRKSGGVPKLFMRSPVSVHQKLTNQAQIRGEKIPSNWIFFIFSNSFITYQNI